MQPAFGTNRVVLQSINSYNSLEFKTASSGERCVGLGYRNLEMTLKPHRRLRRFAFDLIGGLHSVTNPARFQNFRNFVPKHAFTHYCWGNTEFFVERDHGRLAEGVESFHTTRWTIVMRAAQSQAPWGQSALAELCRLYWYPLYTFSRRRGRSPEDAQDLTQSFFLHMVEHRAFKGVDRLKGKFRSFLLASFQNHLSDATDRGRRLKRGGDKNFVQLDAEDSEKRYRLEPVDFLTAEKIFDARWAMTV